MIGAAFAFGSGAAQAATPAGAATTASSTLEKRLEQLTATVVSLDARLAEETRARKALEAEAAAANAEVAALRVQAATARAKPVAGVRATAAATTPALGPTQGGPASIRYKGVTITPGGFLAAEAIYRSRNEISDISSSFSRIPFENSPLAHLRELRGTARQSRFSLLVQGDVNRDTHAAFYGEFDLQGAAQTANSVESNSYNPRLRHLYGTLDWDRLGLRLLAGQTWSLVTLNGKGITPRNELPPGLIDGQYLPGFVWARQPQVRLVKSWNDGVWAAVSLENPQTTFANPATGILSTAEGITVLTTAAAISGFDNGNSLSVGHLPDVVGKLAYEPGIAGGRPLHLEVFGVSRGFETRVSAAPGNAAGAPAGASTSNVRGGGIGGSAFATILSGRLDLQASAMTGSGIGRYGSAQLPDVTLRPDGTAAPIRQSMFLLGATWHATTSLDLYLFTGREQQVRRAFDDASGHYGLGNRHATFTAEGCSTEGGACLPNIQRISQITTGFWKKTHAGDYGQIRIGVQFSHTTLAGFPGADGFIPKTSDDMVFTSFRYYMP
jgi:hypothetical protein